jgi:hypothetical protein
MVGEDGRNGVGNYESGIKDPTAETLASDTRPGTSTGVIALDDGLFSREGQ